MGASAAVSAVVAFFTALAEAIKKRRTVQATAELPAGARVNEQIDADVAELDRLAVGTVTTATPPTTAQPVGEVPK